MENRAKAIQSEEKTATLCMRVCALILQNILMEELLKGEDEMVKAGINNLYEAMYYLKNKEGG